MGNLDNQNPAALVTVARAAHASGDRDLERAARKLLLEQHGIALTFRRPVKIEEARGDA